MTKNRPNQSPVRVGLISLGCAKNLVDAEVMLGSLARDGFEITNDPANADVVIVNTCSFIDAAKEESVDAILGSAAYRESKNRDQGLIVSGCLSQRFREDLPKLLPEVDAFMGIDQVARVSEIVQQALARRTEKLRGAGELPDAIAPHSHKPVGRARRSMITAELRPPNDGKSHADTETGRQNSAHPSTQSSRNPDHRSLVAPAAAVTGVKGQTIPANSLSVGTPLVAIHARPKYIPDYATPRFRLTARHFAYLKIAEGCNHPCSFCTIPRMRGAHRSRPEDDVVKEARRLIADGVKELNLISQDSTYYGLDLRPQRNGSVATPENFSRAARDLPVGATTLCTLLRSLNRLPGEFWIRLLYTHPAHWTDELIQTIADCPKVARYIDMPLQHIHDDMLERMRRETSQQYIRDLIAKIRAGIPGIAIRTTFIVGFPGETETRFDALLEFIRETKFERLGVFTYSREEGTRAARMSNQIPRRTKEQRRQRAMAEQLGVARAISRSFVGRELRVLVERKATVTELDKAEVRSWEHGLIRTGPNSTEAPKGEYMMARGEADAPDIDGRVYVGGKVTVGEFASVRVIGHTDYDLVARPL